MMIKKELMDKIPQAKPFIIKQVVCQWLSLLCTIVIVFLFSDQLQRGYHRTLTHDALLWGFGGMLFFLLLKAWFTKQQSTYAFLASKDVKDVLRRSIYAKLLRLQQKYQDDFSTSEIVQVSMEGIDQLETYFGRYLPQLFYSLLAPLTLFLCLVWMDATSAVVLLLCVPLIPLSIIAIQKFAKRLLQKYWSSYTTLGDSFLENLQGLTTLKIYQVDGVKQEEMKKEAEHFRRITMKVLTMQLNSVSMMDIIAYGGAAIGSALAALHYVEGSISFFQAICIILLSAEFFLPLRLLGSYFHIAMNGIAASESIVRLLALPEKSEGKVTSFSLQSSIKFVDVGYCYDEKRNVLNHLNFTMKPHEFIAICGESGSGKSTIAKVLMGIKTNYQGHVYVQDVERREIKDTAFYKEVTYVTHLPLIIKGSVADNLAMASDHILSDEVMFDVLKKVQLYDFFMEQQALYTPIQEGGANLSGGQKQRLAIARALLKDSNMYIFDEATSNIDVESEEVILTLIQSLAKVKRVILITHRLRSLQNCDQIVLLKQGILQGIGHHKELLQKNAYYQELHEKQAMLESYQGGKMDEKGNV